MIFEETQKQLEQERQDKYTIQFYQSSNHMDVQQEKILIKTQLDNVRKEKSQLILKVKELENSLKLHEQNNNSNCSELSLLKLQQQLQKQSEYLEKTKSLEVKNTLLEAQSKSNNEELRNIRSQVIQLQKDKNNHLEIKQDLETKLRLQTEHVLMQGIPKEANVSFWLPQFFPPRIKVILTASKNSCAMQNLQKIDSQIISIKVEPKIIEKIIETHKKRKTFLSDQFKDKLLNILTQTKCEMSSIFCKTFLSSLIPYPSIGILGQNDVRPEFIES